MRVGGDLLIGQLASTSHVSRRLRVDGIFSISGPFALTSLREDLSVDGWFSIHEGRFLRTLPHGIRVKGLNIYGCDTLEELPEDIQVNDHVSVARCPSFTTLPSGLKLAGDLTIVDCPMFRDFPSDIEIGGNLKLWKTGLSPEAVFDLHAAHGDLRDRNPDERIGTLIRIRERWDEPTCLLKVRCATLPKYYILRVPPFCRTALEANAWTWEMGPAEYKPMEES